MRAYSVVFVSLDPQRIPAGDLPGLAERVGHVDIVEVNGIRRRGDLHEATGAILEIMRLGQLQDQLADERRHHPIGNDPGRDCLGIERVAGH